MMPYAIFQQQSYHFGSQSYFIVIIILPTQPLNLLPQLNAYSEKVTPYECGFDPIRISTSPDCAKVA